MTPSHPHSMLLMSPETPTYDEVLADLLVAARDAVHAAHDRLATASETEPLRRRVAALEAMRRPPTSRRIR